MLLLETGLQPRVKMSAPPPPTTKLTVQLCLGQCLASLVDTAEPRSRPRAVPGWAPEHRVGAQHTAPREPPVGQLSLMGAQSALRAGSQLGLYPQCREELTSLSVSEPGGVSLQLGAC